MRLALPTFLVLSILPTTTAERYHRGIPSKGQDRKPRRKAKAEHEKKHYTVGDLQVMVSSKSGEIAVSRGKMGKAKDKASTVNILIKSIQEVDVEGNAVGNGEGEAEVHSFASLKDTEFEIAVEEYNVPIEIEDDADDTATDAAGTDAADTDAVVEDGGETDTGNDIVDTVIEAGGEINAGSDTDIVDTVVEAGEEVTDSPDTATAESDGLRRYLQDSGTPPSPVTEDEEEGVQLEKEGGELEGVAELESEPETIVASIEEEEDGDGGELGEDEEEEKDAVSEIEGPEEADAPVRAAEGGAEGANVTLSAMLQTESDVRIEMWLISGGGAVGTRSEQWVVQPGDTKFNIQLTHWMFCDPCTDGTGDFVDVQIQIKGKRPDGPKPKEKGARIDEADSKDGKGRKDETNEEEGKKWKKHRKEQAWDLGEGATLDLTSQVRVDGIWTDMPDGFPKLVNEGGKQFYTLRFPRFTDNIWYDPVVTFEEDFNSAASRSMLRFVSRAATYGAMLFAYTWL